MLRVLCMALVGSMLAVLGTTVPAPSAVSTYLCIGYDACERAGYSHFGYKTAGKQMWWRMYSGHNCTNYAAYRVIKNGYSDQRPWSGSGNATNWGVAMKHITDNTPRVGAIAWWRANSPGVGSAGHVAYVEQVVSATEIIISEDSWGGDFSWRRITKASNRWPSGFIHFNDQAIKNTSPPALSGSPVVGSTLTADVGTWEPAKVATAVQWYADGAPIAGATKTSLTLKPAHRKKAITVQVTASKAGMTAATATSKPSATVVAGTHEAVVPPAIDGVPEVGEVLTVEPGELQPQPKKYQVQWYADGSPIPEATDWELPLTKRQVDARVHAVVQAKRAGFRWAKTATEATEPVVNGEVQLPAPTVAGERRFGETLQVQQGTVTPANAVVAHTWLRDGKKVGTGPSYKLKRADVGSRIVLRTVATKDKWKPMTHEVVVAEQVRTAARVKVAPRSRKRAAVIKVRVLAPGANPVAGKVEIKVGKQVVTATLEDGRARVRFDGLVRGERPVRVTYAGSALMDGATTNDKVLVR